MSGAGRGTPRISPAFDASPWPPNVAPESNAEVIVIGNGRWCYRITPVSNSQVLAGTFVPYADGTAPTPISAFPIPRGGVRGLLSVTYNPASTDSQLEVEVVYTALIQTTGKILSIVDSANIIFPNAGDSLAGDLPIYLPSYRTPVQNPANTFNFGLPFCIPAGCPDSVSFNVSELGTVGGTVNLTNIRIDNFGC